MSDILGRFLNWLKENKWFVEVNQDGKIILEKCIDERYNMDNEHKEFLSYFRRIISPDEKTCFLCCDEYNDRSDLAFKWNEFELLSLEVAQDDNEWAEEIRQWWNAKLPIIISVKDGYSFYAIDMKDCKRKIVRGEEPEFEETEIIANSFNEFLELIISGTLIL